MSVAEAARVAKLRVSVQGQERMQTCKQSLGLSVQSSDQIMGLHEDKKDPFNIPEFLGVLALYWHCQIVTNRLNVTDLFQPHRHERQKE